jgi:DNA-binding NtrC family response regulator
MTDSSLNPAGGTRRVQLVSADCQDRDQVVSTLEAAGFRVDAVSDVVEACGRLPLLKPAIVVLDLSSEWAFETAALCQDLVAAAKNLPRAVPVLLLTDGDRFALAGELLRLGASDYLDKPFSREDLLRRLSLALASRPTAPRKPPGTALTAGGETFTPESLQLELLAGMVASDQLLIGRSGAIQKVLEQVRLVAPKNTTVLITGETGTGKERVARAIHALSRGRNRALVSVNCGGIPANLLEDEFFGHVKGAFTDAYQPRLGRFEQAHRGTIFLDEIGDLPLELQPKLLRVLQEREIHRIGGVDTIRVDTRVIAATNVDLWSRVGEGRFREDLFYRINVFPIELPPLRERREDVPLFLDFFLERFCRRDGLPRKYVDPGAETELMARPWPGNIRELENAVEMAVIRSRDREWLAIDDFPEPRPPNAVWQAGAAPSIEQPADFKQLVSRFERDLITRVLERAHGNKSQAAEMLRLKRTTLVEKLKKLDALELEMDAASDDERLLSGLTH